MGGSEVPQIVCKSESGRSLGSDSTLVTIT
jgi:hypothetical protein